MKRSPLLTLYNLNLSEMQRFSSYIISVIYNIGGKIMNKFMEIIMKEVAMATGKAIGKSIEKHLPDAIDKLITYRNTNSKKVVNIQERTPTEERVDSEKRVFVSGFSRNLKKES